ncbi:MAG: hypothetical protein ABJD11_13515 [Gemmatimonadota bacterium]
MTDLPPYANRLRAARERAGFSRESLSKQSGMALQHLEDLESFDEELLMTVTLAQLAALGQLIHVEPTELLADNPGTRRPESRIAPEGIAELIRGRLRARGIPLEELEDEIGWELDRVLEDPATLFEFNADGLRDICDALGVDWLRALPDAVG